MREQNKQRGFSLLELMIAVAIFTIVSGAAMALFVQNEPVFTHQQNQAALNIAIRNSIAQLQLDVTNAGAGYYPGVPNMPGWPVGITIHNNWVTSGSPCNTPATYTYGPNCFDRLNVITTDIPQGSTIPATPPSHPSDSTGLNSIAISGSSGTSITMYLTPTSGTATALAGDYHNGDEMLLISGGVSETLYNAVVLNSAPAVSGSMVKITFLAVSTVDSTNSNDPLDIATVTNTHLGNQFGPGDWAERLSSVTYQVDTTTNPADPQLDRCVGPCATGVVTVLADQVIGFKVGADFWNASNPDTCNDASASTDGSTKYYYNSAACNNNFSMVRAVQISLIGRTNPTDATTAENYRNGFDGGPYQIEAVNIIINPRNMSMNDN
jgi:prepilin-type N-terminal cleavage/methylation domain-containing protein